MLSSLLSISCTLMHRYAKAVKKAQIQNDDVVLQGEGRLYSHFMNTLGLQCQPSENNCSSSSQEVHEHSIASSSLNWFLQRIQTLVNEFVIELQTRQYTSWPEPDENVYNLMSKHNTGSGVLLNESTWKSKESKFCKKGQIVLLLLGQSNLFVFYSLSTTGISVYLGFMFIFCTVAICNFMRGNLVFLIHINGSEKSFYLSMYLIWCVLIFQDGI